MMWHYSRRHYCIKRCFSSLDQEIIIRLRGPGGLGGSGLDGGMGGFWGKR